MRSAVAWTLAAGVLTTISALSMSSTLSAGAAGQRSAPRPPPAPAQTPAPARREAAVPFLVGETLTYDVSWSSMLMAGTATVSVKEKKPSFNSTAYSVVAEGRPIPLVARLYALYYKMDTLLDTYTLLPHRGSLYAEEGKDRRTSTTQFDRVKKRVFFEERSDTTTKLDYPVPAETQDGLSTLYALRAKTFKAGDHLTIPVADSGTLYKVEINVGALETVKGPFGQASAWPLRGVIKDAEGQPVWNNIALWISNDRRRLPLKMQADLPIGAFVLELHSAR